MIKKSLTVLAGGLLIANVAGATELYNQNGNTFSVGGYLKLGYQSSAKDLNGKMDSLNGKYNNSRINFGGTRVINDDLTAFGKVEWKINALGEVKETLLTNRIGFVGVEHKSLGKIAFGRQWSAYYNVASFTDQYEITGNEATGVYDDNDAGGFVGTGRANSALKYDVALGSTALSLQYQANQTNDHTNESNPNIERKYSFGASLVQNIGDSLKVGIAGNHAKLEDTLNTSDVKRDRTSAVAGVSYNSDMLVAAVTVSYNTNMYDAGVSESTSIGQESFVGIKVAQPALVYVGNNYSTTSYDLAGMNDTTDFNYVAIGTKYSLSSDLALSAEYRYDLRSKDDIKASQDVIDPTKSAKKANNFAVAIQYNF